MKKGWEYCEFSKVVDSLRTGLNPRVHFKLNTEDAQGYYVTVRELKGFTFEIDSKTDRINDAAIKRINERSNLQIGDVLFSGTGTIGRTALVEEEPTWWNIKEGVYAITPNKNRLDSKFLIYLFKSDLILNKIYSKASGTTIRSIPMKELNKIVLPIPPIYEQKEIVEYLDSSFAKIDKLKGNAAKNLDEAKALFQSALKDALEPKKGWEKKTIGEMGEIKVGPFGSMLHKKDYIVGGTPLINPMHISNGKIFINPAFSVCQKKCEELSSYIMQQNDIVIGRRGEIGRCAVVGIIENGCVCGTGCMFLRTNISICNPFFIQQLLSSDYIRKKLEEISGGATMKNLSSTALSRFAISIPPLSEQQEIVSRLDSLNEKVNTLQQNYSRICDECDALKQAILRQVFE